MQNMIQNYTKESAKLFLRKVKQIMKKYFNLKKNKNNTKLYQQKQ